MKLNSDFLWGNSVSSMQTEGAWNEDGKGKSVYDIREATETSSDWHVAIDEYHRYAEDIELMKQMGMNCYRFQISWSRVQPDGEGEFNQAGIDFYSNLIDQLLAAGIKPMVALYHFDMPLNLAQKYNGFVSKEVVNAFVKYGKRMVDEFGDRVEYWLTFNEQNLYILPEAYTLSGYLSGDKTEHELFQIFHNIALAHTSVANYIHSKNDEHLKIGGMVAYSEAYPASPNPKDIALTREFNEFVNNNVLRLFTEGKYSDEVKAYMINHDMSDILNANDLAVLAQTKSDYLAFSYYATSTLDSSLFNDSTTTPSYYLSKGEKKNPYLSSNEWGWQIDATGFETVIMNLNNQYHLPIFPIENGIGVKEEWDGESPINDDYRISYHRDHIQALKKAVAHGADVIGYLGWGLIDIPSSQGDMRKRYGVVYINRTNHDLKDLRRVPKKSFYWLQKVIKSNGEDLS